MKTLPALLSLFFLSSCQSPTPMSQGMQLATPALFGASAPIMLPDGRMSYSVSGNSQPQSSPAFEAFYR